MASLLPLAAVVAMFFGQPIDYQAQVYIDHTTETTLYGVACHENFREVEGDAQHLCGELPSNTILLYGKSLGNDVRLWLEILGHEAWHLRHPAVEGRTAWERFREAEAYQYGREYAARSCKGNMLCEPLERLTR